MIRAVTLLTCLFLVSPVWAQGKRGKGPDTKGRTDKSTKPATKPTPNSKPTSSGKPGARESKPQKSPTGENMSSAQKQNVQKLANDLKELKAGSEVTPEQVQKLKKDMLAMCDEAQKPSQQSVQTFATDLSAAVADKNLTTAEKTKLAKDVNAIMTSANLESSEVEAVVNDVKQILTSSGVSSSEAQTIANDMKKIAAELKKNAGSAPVAKPGSRLKKSS